MNHDSPFYITPPNAALNKNYESMFSAFGQEDQNTLLLEVSEELIEKGSAGFLQNLLAALQHHPHLIEKMIFSIKLKFVEKGTHMEFPENYWKFNPEYYRWFHKLSQAPVAIFFLEDEDSRFYTLAGDFLADGKLEIQQGDMKGKQMVGMGGEELQQVMERLYTACWWMLVFCYGSGFNPQPYIEAQLADLGLPLTYEEVNEAFLKDLESGTAFQALHRG